MRPFPWELTSVAKRIVHASRAFTTSPLRFDGTSDDVGSEGAIDAKLENEPERYRASAGVAAPAIVGR